MPNLLRISNISIFLSFTFVSIKYQGLKLNLSICLHKPWVPIVRGNSHSSLTLWMRPQVRIVLSIFRFASGTELLVFSQILQFRHKTLIWNPKRLILHPQRVDFGPLSIWARGRRPSSLRPSPFGKALIIGMQLVFEVRITPVLGHTKWIQSFVWEPGT